MVESEGQRLVAGIDLGSNSFHMIVARAEKDSRVHVLDRLREPVRLAAGLDANRQLTPKAIERGLSALERFGQRVRQLPANSVRAVGTNTLRQAKNGQAFLERAEAALAHEIEIVSGHEEARLIYLGVAHSSSDDVGRHLVIDIGGGSTELVIGERFEPIALESVYAGCVSYTGRFFLNGQLTRESFRQAELAALLELASLREHYRAIGWQRATGSSGTALAIQQILRENKWGETITLEGLKRIKQALIEQGSIQKLSLRGLEQDRAPVIAAGLSIMKAAFESLGIQTMSPSTGALREGLVYELLGRTGHEDVKTRTIATFSQRYGVDLAQAERVERTLRYLFERTQVGLELDENLGETFLYFAARLHEIGLTIAYSGYHKHGAYILEHAEMPGFSREQQSFLAALVHAHRRKIPRDAFAHLAKYRRKSAPFLAALLRIAVRLHHSRSPEPLPDFGVAAGRNEIELTFPRGWLEQRPLTTADLQGEAAELREVGIDLKFR